MPATFERVLLLGLPAGARALGARFETPFGGPEMERCVAGIIEGIRFRTGAEGTVHYPLSFSTER